MICVILIGKRLDGFSYTALIHSNILKKCLDWFRIYWLGFNAQVRKETTAPEPHRIGYPPAIDASPNKRRYRLHHADEVS